MEKNRRNRRLIDDEQYKGKSINTNKQRGLKCDKSILDRLDNLFESYLDEHDQVMVVRYDYRFTADKDNHPDEYEQHFRNEAVKDNTAFSTSHRSFVRNLDRNGYDPKFLVVREQSKEKHQHYHGVMLIDPSKDMNQNGEIKRDRNGNPKVIKKHLDIANNLWNRKLGLEGEKKKHLVDRCDRDRTGNPQENGIIIDKSREDYEEQLDKAFRISSYLAKENQKGYAPHNQREVFKSQLSSNKRKEEK